MSLAMIVPGMSMTPDPGAAGASSPRVEAIDPTQVVTRSLHVMRRGLDVDAVAFWTTAGPARVRLVDAIDWPGSIDHVVVPYGPGSAIAAALGSTEPVEFGDVDMSPSPFIESLGFHRALLAGLEVDGAMAGGLVAYRRADTPFGAADADFLRAVAGVTACALAQSRPAPWAVASPDRDDLTGLASRPRVLRSVARAAGDEHGASLVVVGLDGFAEVNELAGHHGGDHVLLAAARRISSVARPGDVIGRVGGDRFAIVAERCEPETARGCAESLVAALEETVTVGDRRFHLSASVGIADPAAHPSAEEALDAAVAALDRAKAAGRGKIVVATATTVGDRVGPVPEPDVVEAAAIDAAIERTRVVFQPIIDGDGALVGVEALARGPVDTAYENPAVFFSAAETHGRLAALDLAAKRAAFDADVPDSVALFVNVDPSVLIDDARRCELIDAWRASEFAGSVVVELTERSLVDAPGRLLRAVAHCREVGWMIALDDIGARAETLTALRLVRPDIAKLDLRLVDERHRSHAASVAVALDAHRERWPVHVVAEGVETEQHERMAHDLGADLFQGFRYGRPAGLADATGGRPIATDVLGSATRVDGHVRVATKHHLMGVTRVLESMATGAESILLASLQSGRFYPPSTRRQYARLARRCGMAGVLGSDLDAGVVRGVHHATIPPGDPLADEWSVVLLTADGGIALLARDLHDRVDHDGDRRFEYEVTRDPVKVEAAANRLLSYF